LRKAEQLQAAGKLQEAFKAYVSVVDEEYRAARIARTRPDEYLPLTEALLRESGDAPLRSPLLLIRGDLLLAKNDRAAALASYRHVRAAYAARPGYPVEPGREAPAPGPMQVRASGPTTTLGSHRDNWLIRRFIALEAWTDAEAEFARMWNAHATRPAKDAYFTHTLQFALDYSSFLKMRYGTDSALGVLEEQTLRLDRDRVQGGGGRGFAIGGLTAATFLNAVYGEFAEVHRESKLVEILTADPRPAMKRVLAWVLLHQGRTD